MFILVLIGVLLDVFQLLIYFKQKRENNERLKLIQNFSKNNSENLDFSKFGGV